MRSHRTTLVVILLALVAPATAQGAIRVDTTRELRDAIDRIGNRGGTIIVERGRYGKIVVGPRARGARWLTIRAEPGALTKHVVIAKARRVKLVGLRLTNYWGGDALLRIIRSSSVRMEGLSVEGKPGRVARIRVRHSGRVTLRGSELQRCGAMTVCLGLTLSHRIVVAGSVFHDCIGCDFMAVSFIAGLTVRGNTFERALPGPCSPAYKPTVEESALAAGPAHTCNHQDLIQVFGGQHLLFEGNTFGESVGGAAQVYIAAPWPTDDVVVRGNVFQPGATTGLIVGNPPGFNGLASRVLVEGNQILSGAPRSAHRNWSGVANSLIVSDGYLTWPVEQRPIVVGNTFAMMSAPELVCATAQVGPDQGC